MTIDCVNIYDYIDVLDEIRHPLNLVSRTSFTTDLITKESHINMPLRDKEKRMRSYK